MGDYRFNSWLLTPLRHQRERLDSRHRVLSDGANGPVPPVPDRFIRGAGLDRPLLQKGPVGEKSGLNPSQ